MAHVIETLVLPADNKSVSKEVCLGERFISHIYVKVPQISAETITLKIRSSADKDLILYSSALTTGDNNLPLSLFGKYLVVPMKVVIEIEVSAEETEDQEFRVEFITF